MIIACGISFPAYGCNSEKEEIRVLAEAMWREARGEGKIGMIMVGDVILNRVDHPKFPDSVCKVVKQKGQFSWVSKRNAKKPSGEKWDQALEISQEILENDQRITGALFFHAKGHGINWSKIYRKIGSHGNHVFYTYRNG